MKLKNKIKAMGLAVISSFAFVSCDVEVLPLNQIIAENYWTSKADVESVVFSCYTGMLSSSFMERVLVWSEVRSDNVEEGAQISSASDDFKHLLHGNIFETNSYCEFSSFYKIINRCNTVELYAPVIQQRDPNYTESDLLQNLAEVKAIRALCYFYLIRTFGDVPFSRVPSITDEQEYAIPSTKQELILDTLIMDLEANAIYAPKRYVEEINNTARITRNGVYALLADLYLWRASDAKVDPATRNADYLKCVEYCDKVIAAKINEYREDRYGSLRSQISRDIFNKYGFPLIEEWSEGDQASGQGRLAKAYNLIFGQGNSFEALFELTFSDDTRLGSSESNAAVERLYGGRNSLGTNGNGSYLAAKSTILSNKPIDAYEGNGELFSSFDFRSQENFKYSESASYNITKFVANTLRVNVGAKATWDVDKASNSARSEAYANWIFYRLTDVMLMKAEAEVQIAGYIDDNAAANANPAPAPTRAVTGNVYATAKEYYDDAFNIVAAIYERSTPQASAQAKPQRSNFNTKRTFDELVEHERRRELMFEGKRYYDLLRRARRDGNTTYVSGILSSKFTQNSAAMRIKMAMLEFLYMPFSEDEMKRNKFLVQNPAFEKEKKNEQNY